MNTLSLGFGYLLEDYMAYNPTRYALRLLLGPRLLILSHGPPPAEAPTRNFLPVEFRRAQRVEL